MENTAVLQAGLLIATICLYAACLTTHNTAKLLIGTLYALMGSTFLSLVCARWIPSILFNTLGFTFFLLAFSAGLASYYNFWREETNRGKIGARLAYGLGAFLLFTIIIWTFDSWKGQRVEKVIEHVAGKVDTISAVAGKNAQHIKNIDARVDTLARNDTVLAKTVEATKSELWQKTDETGQKLGDKLDNISIKQERMNVNQQKQNRPR